MSEFSPVQIFWANRQRETKVNLKKIRQIVEIALPFFSEKPRQAKVRLPRTVEVTFLNNRDITRIHADFLNDPTPTDVITFAHSSDIGEILVGVSTAAVHAKKFHHEIDQEVALCVIHGLLHLLGYDDMTPAERDIMHREQDTVLKKAITIFQLKGKNEKNK